MRKTSSLFKSRTARRLISITMVCALLLPGSAAWADQPPLKKIPVPLPPDAILDQYVADRTAAIQLGKALFWDMQVGSDGRTACASCHYKAGADPIDVRAQNQLNPGPPPHIFDLPGSGPGSTLTFADFPFFQVIPQTSRLQIDPLTGLPQDPLSTVTRTFNDITGSQGIRKANFAGINLGSAVDSESLPAPTDPIFNVGGVNVRQVTGRNSPSVINAVFNYANFWDGRANNIFNGENPFGPAAQDGQNPTTAAGVWFNEAGNNLVKRPVSIPNASLASQAVGPPNNDVEMAFAGRTFPELGRKMLSLPRPLDLQTVHIDDTVLGGLSRNPTGLTTTYRTMIQNAFVNNLWENNNPTIPVSTVNGTVNFSQIEANFSFFWGISIMLYEATLISDQTPFDRFVAGNLNAMNLSAQGGHTRFNSQCARCHTGSELTNAAVGSGVPNCLPGDRLCNSPAFISPTNHNLIQLDQTLILGGLSDTGFMNLGLRPMTDDGGRAGTAPFINLMTTPTTSFPLSFTLLAQLQAQNFLPFETPSLNTPLLVAGFASANSPAAVQGSFKTPGIRNVELNAPYFHNGSMFDLQQIVEFYARGGNFPNTPDNPTLAKDMNPIGSLRIQGGPEQIDMVNFLRALTDARVRDELAPFDHPQLLIPSGDLADTMIERPATGGAAAPVTLPTFTLTTALTTTQSTNVVIGGIVRDDTLNNDMVTVEVIVNGLPGWATVGPLPNIDKWSFTILPAPLGGMKIGNNVVSIIASTPNDTQTIDAPFALLPTALLFGAPLGATKFADATISVGGNGVTSYQFKLDDGVLSAPTPTTSQLVLTGLSEGFHTISVLGTAVVGAVPFTQANATTATWLVKTIPPVLNLDPLAALSGANLTLSGTVELGSFVTVQAATASSIGPVSAIGGAGIATWSCTISGLKKGNADITVSATDIATNVTTRAASVRVILPDGDFRERGAPDISDALKALHIAVGNVAASAADSLHGDVAPLVNGVPAPDGAIAVDDALVILKKVAGLVNF